MRIEPFAVEDIGKLKNHGGQEHIVSDFAKLPPEQIAAMLSVGVHYSFYEGEEVIACMGVLDLNPWRGVAWALLQSGRPETFIGVHRCTRAVLHSRPLRRIEAHTDVFDKKAERWVSLLGFTREVAYKPYFFQDGRPASIWELRLDGGQE